AERTGARPERRPRAAGTDRQESCGCDAPHHGGEPTRPAAGTDARPKPERAPAPRLGEPLPLARFAPADREHATWKGLAPVRSLEHLEPELSEGVVVVELVGELDRVAKMRVGLAQRTFHGEALEREPREDPHRDRDEEDEIGEVRKELDPR